MCTPETHRRQLNRLKRSAKDTHTHTRTENGKLLLIDFAFRPTATSGTGSVNCTMRPAIWHEARIVFSSFQGTVFFGRWVNNYQCPLAVGRRHTGTHSGL